MIGTCKSFLKATLITITNIDLIASACTGAGISGINAGILFPIKVPKIDLTIFEKNADVVGNPKITNLSSVD